MPTKLHQTYARVPGGLATTTRTAVFGYSRSRFTSVATGNPVTTYYLPYETFSRAEEASTVVQRPTSRGLVTQVLADLPKAWEIVGTIKARDREEEALDIIREMRERDAEILLETYYREDGVYVAESIQAVIIQSVQVSEPVEPVGGSAMVVEYTIRLEVKGEA